METGRQLLVIPVAAGWLFDETGSYRIVLLTGAALLMLAALPFVNLRVPGPGRRTRSG